MKPKKNRFEGVIYSTEFGKTCPGCGHPVKACICHKAQPVIPSDGVVRISRERKGRKGAGVSLITGIPLDDKGLKDLAKQLKQKCGTGGTVKAGVIEIQGDHREILTHELTKRGYAVKLSGG